jgi:hypothetical protein
MTANCWASSSVDPPSSLVKSNECLGFRVSGTAAITSRLKLNPLLVAYAGGFITAVEVCESGAKIPANGRLSFQLIFCKTVTLAELAEKKVGAPPGTQRVIIEFWKVPYEY